MSPTDTSLEEDLSPVIGKSFLKLYYLLRPLIPRPVQIAVRRCAIKRKALSCADRWPIDPGSGVPPEGWPGWPEGKKFAFVLTHDVDTERGQSKVPELVDLEKRAGFRSSFNFVPERYKVSGELRGDLEKGGFEVGVHGLNHDGKYFNSREIFRYRANRINHYLQEWNAVGFRMPAMHHRLDWFHDLQVEYDASTFDTDPFEPYSDGMGTIFPFLVPGENGKPGYVELPYTLPQDFLLFVMLQEKDASVWKRKLDWVVAHGGMALMNTHPDYMNFRGICSVEEYPVDRYLEILQYVQTRYEGMYWNVLPREVARYVRGSIGNRTGMTSSQ